MCLSSYSCSTVCISFSSIQSFELRLKSVEETLSRFPNLAKFESDSVKVNRDITSARAEMKRLEGRVIKSTEDFGAAKTEIAKLGKY